MEHLKTIPVLIVIFTAMAMFSNASTTVAERLQGYILLQVEEHGEAWYIRTEDSNRYYMADGDMAYQMMRYFSLGITDADLLRLNPVDDTDAMLSASSVCETNDLARRLRGEILLQVERQGQAWYVYPKNCRIIYMADGDAAYTIMRFLGLGITNADLATIEIGTPPEGVASESSVDDQGTQDTAVSWPSDIGTSHFGRLTDYGRIDSDLEGGWVRPHAGPFVWDYIEQIEGTYDWGYTDLIVRDLQEDRQAILATVWGFANWDQQNCHDSSDEADEAFIRQMDWMHAPCNEDAYLAWLTAMVERYDGDGTDDMSGLEYPIRHWEMFNEPSIQANPAFFQDEADVYADLLIASYDAIKAVDEDATVLPAGQSGMHADATDYWDDVIKKIDGYFDLGNIHSISSDDEFWSEDYREYLDDNDYESVDFWVTEALVGSNPDALSDDELAQLTFTGYANAFANGATVVFNVGAHDPTGGPGDDSEDTFVLMAEVIGKWESVERLSDSSVKFELADSVVYALWDNASLPASVDVVVSIVEYDGDQYENDAESVDTSIPKFVIVE
jgi:hypothetical protein